MKERPSDAAVPFLVLRAAAGAMVPGSDNLVAEEPLELRLREEGGRTALPFVVTMRTPGDDHDLAVGLLHGEGVIASIAEVRSVERPRERSLSAELRRNVVVVTLAPGRPLEERLPARSTVMGSACGVCGRTSIDDVLRLVSRGPVAPTRQESGGVPVSGAVLAALPAALRAAQRVFASTGGLHATGLFQRDGRLVLLREDVGRHNATDKAIGALLRAGAAAPPILLASGRLGFEIVQKATLAGVEIVAGLSAPTSLAVELAEEAGLTLVGFLKGATFNVYAGAERIAP